MIRRSPIMRFAGRRTIACITAAVGFCAATAGGQELSDGVTGDENPFAEFDFASLLDVRVVTVRTVSGSEGSLFETPAAVTVLESRDLERSISVYLPDVLRLVPGLQVQRQTANQWGISARGFATTYADKMQVLLDGRTLYDPAFSGTIWELMDRPIDEIDRIEAIRGPGAVLWGENAVNGVINFESKSAFDTLGVRTSLAGGTSPDARAEVRYGFRIGDDAAARVWGMGTEDGGNRPASGPRTDDWASNAVGFRFDRELSNDRTFELQGDYTINRRVGEQFVLVDPTAMFANRTIIEDGWQQAMNIRARLEYNSPGDDWYIQAALDRTDFRRATLRYQRHSASFDARRFRAVSDRVNVGLGATGSVLNYDLEATTDFAYRNGAATDILVNTFAQIEWSWVPETLNLLAGVKASYNDYTGLELQPNVRMTWTPDADTTVWASMSRSVSTPTSRYDSLRIVAGYADLGILGGGPPTNVLVPLTLQGSPDVEAEELIGFELGWRFRPIDGVEIDVATYFNQYDRLIQLGLLANDGVVTNDAEGETYGAEIGIRWRVHDTWDLQADAIFNNESLDEVPGGGVNADGAAPQQRYVLRSNVQLNEDLRWDTIFDWEDDLPSGGSTGGFGLDLGLTWTPTPGTEVFLYGRDLLDRRGAETFANAIVSNPSEFERSVFAGVRVEF
ncbi:MAG: TonB-dependent receptor plug domain-containing protein [Phycisphaerales bacterium]